jgi:hypothetical protein
LTPSTSPGTCLEFVSYERRGEPGLLRRAAEWLEDNPDSELISIDVVPPGLMAHETFLRMVVVQEVPEPSAGHSAEGDRLIRR